jgi:hypothetical protein
MKRDILNEEVDQIINQSFWQKGGLKINENTESQQAEVEGDEPQEQQALHEEAHCPLCSHALTEAISDEALVEHLENMLAIISEMEDITDEDIDSIQEMIDDELEDDDSEEDSEDDQGQG